MNRKTLLMGAAALIGGMGAAQLASAQVTSQIYGGGSTLIAPYLSQAGNCYGNPTALVNQGTVLSGPGANETLTNETPFVYTGSPTFKCATQHYDTSAQVNFIGSGSGNGIASLFSHDPGPYWGDTVPGTDPSDFATVNFAASDAGLGIPDVNAYNNGNVGGASEHGVTVVGPGQTPASGQYPNPQQTYGSLVQFPLIIAPVTLAYSAVYKSEYFPATGVTKNYSFNVHTKNRDGSGGLLLSMPVVCGIFNGTITNWNDPAITSLNDGVSLKATNDAAAFNVPIEIVGRSDSSGTTSIFTRALAAQCTSANGFSGTNYFTNGSTTLPANLQGNTYTSGTPNNGPNDTTTAQTGKFTLAKGSSGVAAYLALDIAPTKTYKIVLQGRLGYVGPDYVLPAVKATGANTYNLNVADIQRVDGSTMVSVEPTAAAALLAFGTLHPPQSNTEGGYVAGSGGSGTPLRSNPYDWVEPITITDNEGNTNPLANPSNPKGYPITGTTDYIGYTCYATAATTQLMTNFLSYYETNKTINDATKGLLAAAGYAPLPTAWETAISQTFLAPVATTKKLNLYILTAGTGPATGTGSQCRTATGG